MSGISRLVVRRSLKNMKVQVIDYKADGDVVVAQALSKELDSFGWKGTKGNLPAAYLTGLLAGMKCKGKVEEVIVDMGFQKSNHGSRIYAAIKGFLDAGVNVRCDESIFPAEDRITGKHIEAYAESLKDNKELYEKRFSVYIKEKVDPTKLSALVEEVKGKILAKK